MQRLDSRVCRRRAVRIQTAERQYAPEMPLEIREAVVTAFDDDLFAAAIPLDCVSIVQNLVAGLNHQQIALGRDALDFERAQLRDVLCGEFVAGAGIQVGLWTAV